MGDPKKIRKKYDTPSHPWIKSRIDEEKRLSREFGTKNKKELWKNETVLKKFKAQAKKLISLKTKQAEIEKDYLFRRIAELGLVNSDVSFDAILSLTTDDILSRRLQSVLVKKELARSIKQARQFVTHEHIIVSGKVITSPSYLVSVKEEAELSFTVSSPFFSEDHPERSIPKAKGKDSENSEEKPKKTTGKADPKGKAKKEVKKETTKTEKTKEAPKTEKVEKAPEVKEVKEASKTEKVEKAPEVKEVKEAPKTEKVVEAKEEAK